MLFFCGALAAHYVLHRRDDAVQPSPEFGVVGLGRFLGLDGCLKLLVVVRVLEPIYDGLEMRNPMLSLFSDCALGHPICMVGLVSKVLSAWI